MIINKAYLKQFSLIPLNYNMDEVDNFVDISEKKWLIPVIGDELYDRIDEELQATSGAPSPEISELLVQAVWPYLANCVCYEYLPFSYVHISEVGLTKGHSENSESASLKDVTYLQSQLRANLEERKKYLITWLEEHQQYYPEWSPYADGCCNVPKNDCCGGGKALQPPEPNLPFKSPFNNMEGMRID